MSNGAERVAVVGIGCRFPGGADSPEAFWRLLEEGREAFTAMPAGRFAIDRLVDSEPRTPGKVVTAEGGFLDRIEEFDAAFFGISPREARKIDPQQRLLLEVAWEALEDAGLRPSSLAGSRTGVYVGLWSGEYEHVMARRLEDMDLYSTTGGGRYAAAGRIAFAIDARGPSMTVDTACSSSLVALHLAARALQAGEADVAIAAAANLILQPFVSVAYSRSGMLSPKARCRFGAPGPDGYVRSEGAAALLLKRLADAVRDGDPIQAVLLGSAVNSDGRGSDRLVAPSLEAQKQMLREAYADAGIDPAEVDYIEAHGTGTQAGDIVELSALGRVLAAHRGNGPLPVGSIKRLIGHTEAASGLAGVIKAILALRARRIPAGGHERERNPDIPWSDLRVEVATDAIELSREAAVIGVNSFGVTGTNAHVVLTAPPGARASRAVTAAGPAVVAVSASGSAALDAAVQRLRMYIAEQNASDSPAFLRDLSYTTTCRREHHTHRIALVADTIDDVLAGLRDHEAAEASPHVFAGVATVGEAPKIGFVFSGQGSQWLGMGRELLQTAPAFAEVLKRCDALTRSLAGWSVIDILASDTDALESVACVQPTLTSVQIALAEQLRAWGVVPHAVVGHSMGEVAAAYIAGALSLEDAMRVILTRSSLLAEIAGAGAMALLDLDEREAAQLISDVGERVSIAAVNGPRSTVISGDAPIIDALLEKLDDEGVFCRRVKVDVASHSPQTEPLLPELARGLTVLQPETPAIRFYSTPRPGSPTDALLDAAYWVDNLRRPVQLKAAVQAMIADGIQTFVEIAPHPVLLSSLADIAADAEASVTAFAGPRRDEPEMRRVLELLAKLHVAGVDVAWHELMPPGARVLRLPTYPWQRKRHWLEGWDDWSEERATSLVARPENADDVAYVVEWRERTPSLRAERARTSWMMLGDDAPLTHALTSLIHAAGDAVTRVGDVRMLAGAIRAARGTSFGVIDLRAMDCVADAERDFSQTLQAALDIAAGTIDALLESRTRPLAGTWFITSGVQPAGSRNPGVRNAGQAAVWGYVRTAAPENPELQLGLVDVDPSEDAVQAARGVWAALTDASGETEVALCEGTSFVPRLVRAAAHVLCTPVTWRSDCTYLITGGLGDIGLRVAEEIVRGGGRRLILAGRTPVPPRSRWADLLPNSAKLEAVRRLEHMGAAVHLVSLDVSDEQQLASFLAQYRAEGWPPIRGVIHCAGAMRTGVAGRDAFDAMLAGKAIGAYNLHTLLPDLDQLILFSSIASVLPQSNVHYAAANAVLDTLAAARRGLGQPAVSISWGAWSETGIAADEQVRRYLRILEARGISGFTVEQAANLFGWAVNAAMPHVMLTNVDWRKASESIGSLPLYAELIDRDQAVDPATGRAALLALPNAQRRTALMDRVRAIIGRVLQLPGNAISATIPFGKQGLDSLMAVEFRNRLELEFGLRLPASLAWNYPTLGVLSDQLLARIAEGEEMTPPVETQAATMAADQRQDIAALVGAIADESEEEVIRMLRGGAV